MKNTFPEMQIPAALEIIIWVSALVRIVVCLLPQNRWCSDNGNQKLSIIRNTVFAVTGIGVLILYALSGNAHDYHLTRMVAAILISFGCYLPVTLMSKKHPKVGLLMIPKTCAYIWMIAMGLELLFEVFSPHKKPLAVVIHSKRFLLWLFTFVQHRQPLATVADPAHPDGSMHGQNWQSAYPN